MSDARFGGVVWLFYVTFTSYPFNQEYSCLFFSLKTQSSALGCKV